MRAINLHERGDTKSGKKLPYMLIDVLGGTGKTWVKPSGRSLLHVAEDAGSYQGIILNDANIDDYEPLGDIILVENRDVWMNIRPLLPEALKGAALLQYEGWLADRLTTRLAQWSGARIFLLADYDPVGFQNYLKLQKSRPDARMLIPELTDSQLDQWGNGEVWQKSVAHLYTLHQWAGSTLDDSAQFFKRIAHKGLAIEQEALMGIQELMWQSIAGDDSERQAGNAQALRRNGTAQG